MVPPELAVEPSPVTVKLPVVLTNEIPVVLEPPVPLALMLRNVNVPPTLLSVTAVPVVVVTVKPLVAVGDASPTVTPLRPPEPVMPVLVPVLRSIASAVTPVARVRVPVNVGFAVAPGKVMLVLASGVNPRVVELRASPCPVSL